MNPKEFHLKIPNIQIKRCSNSALQNLLLSCVMLSSVFLYSQQSNWSVEVNFPYTFGDNFVDEGYNGILDAGLNYRIKEFTAFDLGASANVGFFTRDDSRFSNTNQEINGTAILIQPRVFASFKIASLPQWHPMVGLGYSIFAFNINDQNFNGANFQQNASDSGANLNLGIAYDVSEKLFFQLQYDYIRLTARDVIDTPFNRNVNILKLGIGYRL